MAIPARRATTAILVAAMLAVTGCNRDSGQAPTAGASASAVAAAADDGPGACPLLSGEELQAATGIRVGGGDARSSKGVEGCTWRNEKAPFSADLDIHRADGPAQYKASVENLRKVGSFGKERAVKGLGNQAAVFEQAAGDVSSAFLLAVKGETMVQLTVVGVLKKSNASKAAEELARLVAERL